MDYSSLIPALQFFGVIAVILFGIFFYIEFFGKK